MLAAELRLGGADVLVLETRGAPTTESRASTLHARTMEILDSRGLLPAFGSPPREVRGHFGGIALDLTLPSAHFGQWKVPQTETERVLQDWAQSLGARITRLHTLRALRTSEQGVEAVAAGPHGPVRIRARYLVGCDGEDSTVRRLLGAHFPGQDAHRERRAPTSPASTYPAGASSALSGASRWPHGAATASPASWCTSSAATPQHAPPNRTSPRCARSGSASRARTSAPAPRCGSTPSATPAGS